MPGLPSIEISLSASPLLALLIIAAAGVSSFLFYRFTLPRVPPATRATLALLRGASLAVAALMLLQPVLRTARTARYPPVVALLLDRSASMTIADGTGSRAARERELATSVIPPLIPRRAETALYSFGASLRGPLPGPPDTLADEVTDIAGALRAIGRERERRNIAAVLLLSDGVVTRGENPALAAPDAGVPVIAIGIGDTAEQKDVLVSRVSANDVVYAGTTAPVDVVLRSSGYGGEQCEVTLQEGAQTLDRTVVTLPAGTAEVSARLTYTPRGEGTRRYQVRAAELPGELTTANNRRAFTVRVMKSSTRVLLLASAPGADLSLIRTTLEEDANIALRVLTQKMGGGYYEGNLTPLVLDSAECLCTLGVPDGATSPGAEALIRGAVAERHLPVLSLAGKAMDPARLSSMVPSLPVAVETALAGEQEIEFAPDLTRLDHPLMALAPDAGRDVWGRLPPLFAQRTVYRLREGSIAFGSPRLRGVVLPQPLLALRDVGGTRSLCLMAYGVWRWRLMTQGDPQTAPLFSSFLSAAVRWLTAREDSRGVRVAPVRAQFAGGEPVTFEAQIYNESAQPVEDARVAVDVSGSGIRMSVDLVPKGNGRYEGALEGLPPGEYTYRAAARRQDRPLGADAGSFTVGGLNLEFLNTRMDAGALRQIAYRSAGLYLPSDRARDLAGCLDTLGSLRPREEVHGETFELHRSGWALGLIVVLLSAEWILRRRNGML